MSDEADKYHTMWMHIPKEVAVPVHDKAGITWVERQRISHAFLRPELFHGIRGATDLSGERAYIVSLELHHGGLSIISHSSFFVNLRARGGNAILKANKAEYLKSSITHLRPTISSASWEGRIAVSTSMMYVRY